MNNAQLVQITASERLILRRLHFKDGETVFRYRNIPEVAIFQGWTPTDVNQVNNHANEMAKHTACQPGLWEQIILENKLQQVVGDVAVCIDLETQLQAELGVALDPVFQKQGYASEAIAAICSWLFKHKQLHRIHVSIDPRNTASLNLFARVGFRQEAHHLQSVYFKGVWCDDIVMAVLKKEWSD